jgi:hypothetical protein
MDMACPYPGDEVMARVKNPRELKELPKRENRLT